MKQTPLSAAGGSPNHGIRSGVEEGGFVRDPPEEAGAPAEPGGHPGGLPQSRLRVLGGQAGPLVRPARQPRVPRQLHGFRAPAGEGAIFHSDCFSGNKNLSFDGNNRVANLKKIKSSTLMESAIILAAGIVGISTG